MFFNRLIPIGFALAVVAMVQAPSQALPIDLPLDLITNGGFETGDFTGWTNSAYGLAYAETNVDAPGNSTPVFHYPTPSNADGGNYYAVSELLYGQTALTQTFTVADITKNYTLSFDMFNRNYDSAATIDPSGLNYLSNTPNQHMRVDLLSGGSGTYSTTTGLLHNFYIGTDGVNAAQTPYNHYEFDVTPYFTSVGSYDFRFAGVANQNPLIAGIDNVHIYQSEAVVATPEPETWAMMGLGMFALAFIGWKRKRGESQAEVSPVLAS